MTRNLDVEGNAFEAEAPQDLPAQSDIDGTVLFTLHNHGRFVRGSLEAIIGAWCPGYELLLIDDASRDDSFAEALAVLSAHPEIPATIMRSETNVGHGLVAQMLEFARGRFIVQADSDDLMMPDRLSTIAERFRSDARCRLVTSNALKISPEGIPIGLYDTHCGDEIFDAPHFAADREGDTRWLGASAAYHREIFEAFPLFDAELFPYGLDLVTPLRALLIGTHHYIAKPLVRWRLHAQNHHRLAGHYSSDHVDRHRYQALAMLVLAQKVRDARFAEEHALRPGLGEAAAVTRALFADKFDSWSRSYTTSLTGPSPATRPETSTGFMPMVPPIPTLALGERFGFTDHEFGGRFVRKWDGCHAPEDWGTWLQRCAAMTFRLISIGPTVLHVEFKTHSFCVKNCVSVKAGIDDWRSFSIGSTGVDTVWVTVPIFPHPDKYLSLLIVSHDSARPSERDSCNPDDRLLGVGIVSIVLRPSGADL